MERFLNTPGTIELGQPDPAAYNENHEFVGRGLAEYCERLKLKPTDFADKTVVDLGAGISARLAREVRERYSNTAVYSVSPDYQYEEYRKRVADIEGVVAASADSLPFADNSVDLVVSLFMIGHVTDEEFRYTHEEEEVDIGELATILKEAHRVLKPGGVFAAYPLHTIDTMVEETLKPEEGLMVVDEDVMISSVRTVLPDVDQVLVHQQEVMVPQEDGVPRGVIAAAIKFVK